MLHCVHCLKVEWKSDTHLGSFSLHFIFYFLRPSPLYCLQTRLTFHGTTGVLRNNSFWLTTLFLSSTNILLFQLMLLSTYLVPGFLLKSLHLSVPLIFPRTCNDGITNSNKQLIQGHTANGYIGYGNSNLGFFFFLAARGLAVPVIKNLSANAGDIRDMGSIPGSGRSPGEGNDNPLQYFWLENSVDRRTWQAMVHRVTKSWTQPKWLNTHKRARS